MKKIYIVLTQTGTLLSRVLKRLTGAKYNHVSIALDEEFNEMYSFGRINPYNPFWGGFVKESPTSGTFKRFKNTDALVLCVYIDDEKFAFLSGFLKDIYFNRKKFHYNYGGVFFGCFHKVYAKQNRYYCSEFVKYLLVKSDIIHKDALPEIVQPIDFLDLFGENVCYEGKLKNYSL